MGRTSKPKAKTKATKRQRIKDLSPKDTKQVKGGGKVSFGDIPVSRPVDKSSPIF